MNHKIAVVTGSNSGFGFLSTLELAQLGYTVIATMRDPDKGNALIQQAEKRKVKDLVQILPLDVTSEASVKAFANYLKQIGRVDLLLNNAGYASGGFSEEVTINEYRNQFETNVFGVMRITQCVLPYMRKQGNGKIINLSSISGKFGFPGLSPYVSSKHALEGYSESLRLELKPFGITVHLIEPGSYRTNIWDTGKKITPRSLEKNSPYYAYMKAINNEIEAGAESLGDPMEIAAVVREIALNRKNSFRIPVGKGVRLTLLMKAVLPWTLIEKLILKKLGINFDQGEGRT
ncbi:SDR family oxidoreductase (plasmid) [Cytobacillus spongiae]|uniref:SDR family oxidoreductase n=1 Tax=Cytobacillus spongiae TaxID=2901381 RepID=UPI001F33459F|nr:SDR family oxidoreductase [Cytobacillus spongiae]UII58329.1 SDR family oxidoreductase [Cytobacillus spongiae]